MTLNTYIQSTYNFYYAFFIILNCKHDASQNWCICMHLHFEYMTCIMSFSVHILYGVQFASLIWPYILYIRESFLALTLDIGASYKGKLPHFEISVKGRIFVHPLYLKKKNVGPYIVNFSSFRAPKFSFPGRKTRK
jgi:hypothetical protein